MLRSAVIALSLVILGCESTPILLYHSVGEAYPNSRWVKTDAFRAQMIDLLDRGYTPITAGDLDRIEQGAPPPPQPIVLTFDDGYRNFYLNAYPILHELGIPATMLLPTTRIADSEAGRVHYDIDYLTWSEVKEMAENGIEMGAHSRTHPRLRDLTKEAQRDEIEGSMLDLEAHMGQRPTVFAYPGGSFDGTTRDLVESCGYQSALSVSSGVDGRYERQRISVHVDVDLKTFRKMIEGSWWETSNGVRSSH